MKHTTAPARRRLILPILLAALCPAVPVQAQTSYLRGYVSATNAGPQQQIFTNQPSASLTGLVAHDELGNDGTASGALSTIEGNFSLSSHACSGGGPGYGGNGNGTGTAFVTLDYVVISPTIPAGTPVSVKVRWATHSNVMAVGQDLVGANSGANAGASGQVTIYVNGTAVENRSGQHTRRHNTGDGISGGNAGTLNMVDSDNELTLTVPLGLTVRIYMYAEAGSASSAEGGSTIDADVQLGMMWGISPLTADCTVVLQSNHQEAAPSAAAVTHEAILNLVPVRPNAPGFLPCFRIPSQPLSVGVTCHSTTATTLSVTPLGTGPFTYRWQWLAYDGRPWADLAEGTNLLFGQPVVQATNVTSPALDARILWGVGGNISFRCIITNPCGDITSAIANLTVTGCCPADVGAQGGIAEADGHLDNNDFVVYINQFFTLDPRADFGRQGGLTGPDGLFDNNDFVVYINQFFTGC